MKPTQIVPLDPSSATRTLAGLQTIELVTFGQTRGWEPRVVGNAPIPENPVRVGEWLIVPVEEDSSAIPARALRRVQALYEAGLRPQGFVIVHEAPMQLTAPYDGRTSDPTRLPELSPHLKMALGAAGHILAVVAQALAMAGMVAIGGLPAALFMGIAMLDPMLIAVTEDGDWVEIDRWWNE